MMKDQSIVCFANDWESDPTSKHQIMRILSKSNRILWVNSIGMRRPTLSRSDVKRVATRVRGWFDGLQQVNDNLFHFTPVVLPFPSSRVARAVNRYIVKASVLYYKKKLSMNDVQLWTFLPNVGELVGHLGEELVVYYCVDEWSKFSFIDGASMKRMEARLLQCADLVITSAEHLYRDKKRLNPNTYLINHGVDYEYFSRVLNEDVPLADDIKTIKRPIIGFFGLIHEWIDLDLIETIAKARPEWSVVLIGKCSVNVQRLVKVSNVYLLGQKPYKSLIHYCKAFDIGIIPFLVNELTLNVNPIKLREYMAAGLPVVSTALPEVKNYADLIEVGRNAGEMIEKIEYLLRADSREERLLRSRRMKDETWEKKVLSISNIIASKNRSLVF